MLRRIPRFIVHPRIHGVRPFTTPPPTHRHSSFPPIVPESLNHPDALQEMSLRGAEMKFKDYDAVLNECVNRKSFRGGQRVQAHMIKTHYHPPLYLRTRMIVLYVRCEALADARKVFDEMPERNVVSWTALISGYTRSSLQSEALRLFVHMLRSGIDPNEYTFATVLTACIGVFGFEYGRQIHSLIVKSPFEFHTHVGSSLLDLYAKAGRIDDARFIFGSLPERDVVSCTALISGYAQLGFDQEALELFCALQAQGMASNYVTYASVLTALSGLAVFEYGRQVHGHVIRCEQSMYVVLQNSLIDMYSKCGNLTYARKVFDEIRARTVVSWNAMMAGYSKHGNGKAVVDLYNAMRKDDEIRPDSTTLLTVLSGCSHGGMENTGLEIFNENDGISLGIEHYGCVVDLLGRAGEFERALQFIEDMPLEANAAIWGSLLGACKVHRNTGVGIIAATRLLEIEPENAGNYVILCNLYACEGRWDEERRVRETMKQKAVVKEPGRSWIECGKTLHTFYGVTVATRGGRGS